MSWCKEDGEFLFRPVTLADIPSIKGMAFSAKTGLTSLPKDDDLLQRKIQKSVEDFKKTVTTPHDEIYIFVLEHLPTKTLAGTSSIYASVGVTEPFYNFEIQHIEKSSAQLDQEKTMTVLVPKVTHNGPSEIGGLYLKKAFRGSGVGKLLSFSRFEFIKAHSERFQSMIIAEIRGVSDSTDRSLFWTHVSKPFFGLPFKDADLLSAKNKQFIGELMPKHPIYVHLLPQEVQDVIGKAHPLSERAMQLLMSLGFEKTNLVDIFDGGPVLALSLSLSELKI